MSGHGAVEFDLYDYCTSVLCNVICTESVASNAQLNQLSSKQHQSEQAAKEAIHECQE